MKKWKRPSLQALLLIVNPLLIPKLCDSLSINGYWILNKINLLCSATRKNYSKSIRKSFLCVYNCMILSFPRTIKRKRVNSAFQRWRGGDPCCLIAFWPDCFLLSSLVSFLYTQFANEWRNILKGLGKSQFHPILWLIRLEYKESWINRINLFREFGCR